MAREIALDVACNEHSPYIVQHIPGVDNVIADPLSRRFMPGAVFTVPECLRNVEEMQVPPRPCSYLRTPAPPPDATRKGA